MNIMRLPPFALALLVVPGIALAQGPGIPADKIACLQTELVAAGLPASVTEELLAGRLANPERVVQSTLGDDGLHRVAQACFPEETGAPPAGAPRSDQRSGQPHAPVSAGIPAEVAACLKEKVGEQAFAEVSSGQRPPTPAEIEQGKVCFPSGPPGGDVGGPIDLPADKRACVVGILGEQTFEDMRQGRIRPETLSPELMRRVGLECFKEHAETIQGANPDVVTCFQGVEQRYGRQALESGPPSGELRQEIEACLQKDPHYRGSMMPSAGSDPAACVEQCSQVEGGKFSREQCAQMCTGQPPAGSPFPTPGVISPEQCVQECSRHQPPETCQQLCAGPGGGAPLPPFPGEFPVPSHVPVPGGGPYPQPYPTGGSYPQPYPESSPAPGQNCTTTCETVNGATRCQTQCAGGNVQGAATEEHEVPWLTAALTRFLLNLLGF